MATANSLGDRKNRLGPNHRFISMNIFSLTSMAGLTAIAAVAMCTSAFAAAQAPAAAPAISDRITNPVAEFAGIDKITGRIITFDVYIDETVQFGALQVTPRICYSRPENEEPK